LVFNIILTFYREEYEITLLRIGGNQNNLDLLSQFFPPEKGLITLDLKYKSNIADFYRKLVIY
jgi:hypothetical protein